MRQHPLSCVQERFPLKIIAEIRVYTITYELLCNNKCLRFKKQKNSTVSNNLKDYGKD